MKPKLNLFLIIFSTYILVACNMPTEPIEDNGLDKNGILTAAAQTVEAILTGDSQQTIEETATPTFEVTSQDLTETPDPNDLITSTVIPDEATEEIDPACNLAYFISDVTVKDGTDFEPSEVFIKTWRLKNVGTCTWTSDYELVFFDGYSMGGNASQQLTNIDIAPEEEMNISIELTAPIVEGKYKGFWKLRSPEGTVFSFANDNTFWVEIDVVE